jgi:transcriptional regulator with XRE-family HTH domain
MERDDWRQWMAALGRRVRRARLFLKLSQAEVAQMAGVSQGAMSRLEHGKGLETPMSVVLKLHAAMARSLEQCDPALLDDDLLWVRQFGGMLTERRDDPCGGTTVDELSRLFQAVRELPPARQSIVVGVIRALLQTVPLEDIARRR